MDTSMKRHFVFTDLFTTVDSTRTHDKETCGPPHNDNNSNRHLQHCNATSRVKEISIGMLTNHVLASPCSQHQRSSCKECEIAATTPKRKLPLMDCANRSVIKVEKNNVTIVPKTPPKSSISATDPLTPTSNLKLLTDLASRENIPHWDEFKSKNDFQEEDLENTPLGNGSSLKCFTRKDKSLGLLAAKFLSQYPEYPPAEFITEISLDKVSNDLNVGRRRIYDVVNVLEAVQIVKKCAKNVYAWLGKTNLKLTLARLKKLADQEKLGEQISSLVSLSSQSQPNGMLKECSNSSIASSTEFSSCDVTLPSEIGTIEDNGNPYVRKEKSLGTMSQKFIMLLLVSNPQVLSLDLAARFLIGESGAEDKNSTVYKTKMRRLYSITHVLTSLALIKKVEAYEMRGSRKPAYRYVGPTFDDISAVDLEDFENALLLLQSPSGLLTKRQFTEDESSLMSSKRVKLPRARSETVISDRLSISNGKLLTRRPSLQDVCEVAEKERRRLLFPITQHALENMTETKKASTSVQSSVVSNQLVAKTKTSTAILLTSNGTPLRVISISSSANGSLLRLVPSTATSEGSVDVRPEKKEIPLVQLPLVLQFKSEQQS